MSFRTFTTSGAPWKQWPLVSLADQMENYRGHILTLVKLNHQLHLTLYAAHAAPICASRTGCYETGLSTVSIC
jgi:hypothetical protein